MAYHDGHRERMRKRFLNEGLENFAPHEVLEFALFYTIPRANTNEIAHRLLEEFGDIKAVLSADPLRIQRVEGVGEKASLLLNFLGQLVRYYHTVGNDNVIIYTPFDAGKFLLPKFIGATNEQLYVLFLDNKLRPITCKQLAEGSVNKVAINVHNLLELAILHKASSVILAHNHPRGIALPSNIDIETTRQFTAALKIISVNLLDHLIFDDTDFVSLNNKTLGETYII